MAEARLRTSVMTYRLGSQEETEEDVWASLNGDYTIMDQTARTIADWWKSSAKQDAPLVALAQGTEFDIAELRGCLGAIDDWEHCEALSRWLDELEGMLKEELT